MSKNKNKNIEKPVVVSKPKTVEKPVVVSKPKTVEKPVVVSKTIEKFTPSNSTPEQSAKVGKAFINEINKTAKASGKQGQLKVVSTVLGDTVVMNVGTKDFVPSQSELEDFIYPSLSGKIIEQSVLALYRKHKKVIGQFFTKETWTNGLKDFVMNGIKGTQPYSKDIAIEDWNPEDPFILEWTMKALPGVMVSIKIFKTLLITAFTTPQKLGEFYQGLTEVLTNSIDFYFVKLMYSIIFDHSAKPKTLPGFYPGAELPTTSVYNKTVLNNLVGTESERTENQLIAIQQSIYSFATPSQEHLNLPLGILPSADTLPVSASGSEFMLLMTAKFQSQVNKLNSKTFNFKELKSAVSSIVVLDPTVMTHIAGSEVDKIDALLIQKGKFTEGVHYEGIAWDFKAPKLQNILEQHTKPGFATNPFKIAYKFTNS